MESFGIEKKIKLLQKSIQTASYDSELKSVILRLLRNRLMAVFVGVGIVSIYHRSPRIDSPARVAVKNWRRMKTSESNDCGMYISGVTGLKLIFSFIHSLASYPIMYEDYVTKPCNWCVTRIFEVIRILSLLLLPHLQFLLRIIGSPLCKLPF